MRDFDHGQAMQEAKANRRRFLESGLGSAATATVLGAANPASAAQESATRRPRESVLPTRTLGRTGVEVTILNLGTFRSVGLDRILRFAWAHGIRYVDTAASYGSEPAIARWLKAEPDLRKQVFLVTKDHPASIRSLLNSIDRRLESLQTDFVDLYFLHALGDHDLKTEIEWPRSKEFKETAEALRKSGKARFVGFSCHHPRQAEILQNAAQAGYADVIMVRNNPWLAQEAPMNRALDACFKRGIGLVSMKQVAGHINLEEVARRLPELKEKGLSPYQGLLQAIWTDERFASVCVSMRNTDQVRENAEAARTFRPMTKGEIERLRDACIAARPTLCADCDGRCSRAAGTDADLWNLTRLLTYHEHHGDRSEARRLYAQLPPASRDWSGADLAAAQAACPNKLDFATLLPRATRILT